MVSILLLECTSVLYLSTDATMNVAFNEAHSRLNSSFEAIQVGISSLPQNHSKEDYLKFILDHRLGMSSYFSCTPYSLYC